MRLDGTDGQTLLSYYAAPGSPELDAFALLDATQPALPDDPYARSVLSELGGGEESSS